MIKDVCLLEMQAGIYPCVTLDALKVELPRVMPYYVLDLIKALGVYLTALHREIQHPTG
jgi:hypothetical protein